MPNYSVPCDDGSDPGCYGTVEVFIDKEDLDEDEVNEFIEENDIYVPTCGSCGSDYTRNQDGDIIAD